MKKIFISFIVATLVCSSLCACSSETGTTGENADTLVRNSFIRNNTDRDNDFESGDMQFLCNPNVVSACNTENGYYYMTEDMVKLRGGNYGYHLMYMDFAAKREVYLCSTAGCKHDSPDCPAVFLSDDFSPISTKIFVFKDNLYILSREYDDDGTVSQDVESITIGNVNPEENQPAALYRANLDGTGRQKIYTFDSELTLEDKVIGNDKGIYIITKKLSVDKEGNETYTTSSQRKLVFLNLSSLSLKEICPMDFNDNISWQIIGCCQNDFVLCGTDFGREISRDEKWNDDVYKELYNNSSEVYALLNQNGGELKEVCRQSNKYFNSVKVFGNRLYLSSNENQNIEVLNVETGERKTLCTLPQNLIMDSLGDMLCCRSWNLGEDQTWYFVNTKTGEITH
ncbi:MAG: hypothetical protein K2M60_07320, partial [Lachnospiraceae bacterium]|nr:hypothetical protein [Lachnospiraceae bacterium]